MSKQQWKIADITHSGRKGIRDEKVDDRDYEDVFGAIIKSFDPHDVKPFDVLDWNFFNNKTYEWWHTSPVIAISLSKDERTCVIETINTIYKLVRVWM